MIYLITAGVVLLNLIIGLLIGVRSKGSIISASLYTVATTFMALWALSTFAADMYTSHAMSLLAVRASYFAAFMVMLSLLLFAGSLVKQKAITSRLTTKFLLGIVFAFLAFTDLIVSDIESEEYGVSEVTGPLYFIFIAIFLSLAVLTLFTLFRSIRDKKTPIYIRSQLRLILLGIVLSFSFGFVMNILFPLITGNYSTAKYGPVGLIFIALSMSIAIVKHGLFDIRLIIARTLAYVLTLSLLLLAYAVISVSVVTHFLHSSMSFHQELVHLFSALFLGITFQPVKNFFDRLTDKLFFRRAYDTQHVLDELSGVIVSEVELAKLLKNALLTLEDALKPAYIAAVLFSENGQIVHRTHRGMFSGKDFDWQHLLRTHEQKIVFTDLIDPADNLSLVTTLRSQRIAVVSRLETSKNLVGFLFFGYKQSGDMYVTRDEKLINLASHEIAIAAQNSLRLREIQQFNKTLQARIEDATMELRHNNEKLKNLDKAKDEFISMASHQLRTPLTSIKGYLSMVLDGDAGPLNETQQKVLEEAYASSQRMVYLIGDFLNVSRLKTGKFIVEHNSVNIADIVQEEVDQLQSTAQSRNITLMYQKPQSFPHMQLDENKMRQVIMNFIDNAIFYSKPGGTTVIELTKSKKEIVLRVKDDGIGVPVAERKDLFTKFYRASNARKARPDGTGIGLFMAKKVIIAHGGALIFETTEGKGSTFGFRLPLP